VKSVRQGKSKGTCRLTSPGRGRFSPGGQGKDENQGFDAFVPLIDSGISLYVWSSSKFFSGIIYTCKGFDSVKATQITQEFFRLHPVESLTF
jgi:hypothetical protein